MIEGKKPEIVKLKSLAEELKEGVPDMDENYLNEQLADLDSTVAILAKSCAMYRLELENGFKQLNNFYAEYQRVEDYLNQRENFDVMSLAELESKIHELSVRCNIVDVT